MHITIFNLFLYFLELLEQYFEMSWIFGGNSDNNGLPDSLPRTWPNSSEDEISERAQREISVGGEQRFHFRDNFVKTSKYELYNFLPKFLLEEFNPRTKVANCYFLAISGMQCLPAITNTGGYPTTLVPLSIVVTVDAVFQILEDISRHKADLEANSSISCRFCAVKDDFENVLWSELKVGDFVKIATREKIPADIVVVSVHEKSHPSRGICYVETKSLDGETNLKMRHALPCTYSVVRVFVLFLLHITSLVQFLCLSLMICSLGCFCLKFSFSGERSSRLEALARSCDDGTPQQARRLLRGRD